MRIGIDLDGVLANFNREFAKIANEIWPGQFPDGYEPTEWSYGLSDTDAGRVWKVIKKIPNFWMTLRPYFDNVRAVAVHRIEHPEDEIIYLTARSPVEGLPIVHQSQRWLDMCGIGGIGTAVLSKPEGVLKISIYRRLAVDNAIDDHLPTVKEGRYKITLLDQPWNREHRTEDITVVRSMKQFLKEIKREKV